MKINWKVRIKNRVWWLAIIPAVLLVVQAILNIFGITFDYTELYGKLAALVSAVFALLALLGITADPTTEGVGDSEQAMSYESPGKENASGK